ncbi:MAG: hypothetical protein IPK68_03595 [Bdellovibrionales bacterium]|nr:hypothetical protein [Bdellovibrionales bacterium]
MTKFILRSWTALFFLLNGLVQTGSAEMPDGMLRALFDANVYAPLYFSPSKIGAGFNSYFFFGHLGYESLFATDGSSAPKSRIYFGPSLIGLLHLSVGHPMANTEGRSYRLRIGDCIPTWNFNRKLKDSFLRTLSVSLIGEYFEKHDINDFNFGISIGISFMEILEFQKISH